MVVIGIALFLSGCKASRVDRDIISPESFRTSSISTIQNLKNISPFMKVHMLNGNLYVFSSWNTDDARSIITGNATLYNSARDSLSQQTFTIGLDSIALLETNVIRNSGSALAMTVFTGITAAVTIYCIANPKACFGSCPTFYVSDGDTMRLHAEGFSSSISPSLEATDIDALYQAQPSNGMITVVMKN
jgi:hypothetical protein